MTSKPQRVTNGQRAAVCGLLLVGIPLTRAAKIVGSPIELMKSYLPEDWCERIVPARRWKPEELAGLREAYEDPAQRTATIASRYGVTIGHISKIAARKGWKRRRPRGRPVSGEPTVRSITTKQRTVYFKLRKELAMPHKQAIAEAVRP